jgi:hypothetical protein
MVRVYPMNELNMLYLMSRADKYFPYAFGTKNERLSDGE